MESWDQLLNNLHKQFQLVEDELNLLHHIDQELLDGDRPAEALFSYVVEQFGRMVDSTRTRILLKRGQFLENTYSTVESDIGDWVPAADSITSQCLTKNDTINLGELNEDQPEYLADGTPVRHSLLAAPIRFRGEPIGVLSAESVHFRAFDAAQVAAAVKVAAQVSLALQKVQSFDVAQLFADVDGIVFSDSPDSQSVIQAALDRVILELGRQRLRFSGAQILFLKSTDELEIVHSTSPSDVGLTIKLEESISGEAVKERRAVVVDDVRKKSNYVRLLGSEIKSEIAVPIFVGGGSKPFAVLNVESEELDVFSGFNEVAITSFADRMKTLLAFTKLRADVTESLELRSSNELLIAVGDQASNMVHRLNNTVGAMRFQIKELQQSHAIGELRAEELTESLDSLLSLADRTLDMPRRVTRLLSKDENSVDINRCVRDAIAEIGIRDSVALDVRLSDEVSLPAPDNFDIVVQNLVQNAMDAMPDGGRLAITTAVEQHQATAARFVRIEVTDTGTGIAPEIQSRIFDLTFSTKSAARKGMGLGLWWVRNFVRRAGGELSMTSTLGVGTTFVVRLPLGTIPATG